MLRHFLSCWPLLAAALLFLSGGSALAQDRDPVWVSHLYRLRFSHETTRDAVALPSGGVYNVATSIGATITARYGADGELLWMRRFPHPSDTAHIALMPDGGICVAGGRSLFIPSSLLLRYSASGALLWSATPRQGEVPVAQLADMKTDTAGNIYLAGTVQRDRTGIFVTAKLGPDGRRQWVRRYRPVDTGPHAATALAIDEEANVYTTGSVVVASSTTDFASVAYGADGTLLWVRRFDSGSNSHDQPVGIAAGGGSVYVLGTTTSSQARDILTVAYTVAGQYRWDRRLGEYTGEDQARRIALSPDGSVVVSGSVQTGSADFDFVTAKYLPSGDRKWRETYDAGRLELADDMAVSPGGEVAVTGRSAGADGTRSTVATVVYAPSGAVRWSQERLGAVGEPEIEQPGGVGLDAAGRTYVAGGAFGGETGFDLLTAAYDLAGTLLWRKWHAFYGRSSEWAHDAVVDASGNTYVLGFPEDWTGLLVVKFTADGQRAWTRHYGAKLPGVFRPLGFGMDSAGRVYVAAHRRYPESMCRRRSSATILVGGCSGTSR
jgi:hypothetical protein